MIGGLFIGWVLSLFGFIGVVKTGMLEVFNITITDPTYYFMFAVFGLFTRPIRVNSKTKHTLD